MQEVKFIQTPNFDLRSLKKAVLESLEIAELSTTVGQIGITTDGAILYVVPTSTPGIVEYNKLKELELVDSTEFREDGEYQINYLELNKGALAKEYLTLNITQLVQRFIEDARVTGDSTWSSQKITEYIDSLSSRKSVVYTVGPIVIDWLNDPATDIDGNPIMIYTLDPDNPDDPPIETPGPTWEEVYGKEPQISTYIEFTDVPGDPDEPLTVEKITIPYRFNILEELEIDAPAGDYTTKIIIS